MRGRPPKSIEDLKVFGGYREDRHGSRAQAEPKVDGLPQRPEGLNENEAWLWDLVVSEYGESGPVRALDTAALLQCCKLWDLLTLAQEAASLDPLDKNIRVAVTGYYAAWDRAAAKLGLTPRDRRSVRVENQKPSGVRRRERA